MLYNRCTGIYNFGNNTYPWRIRSRSNLGHIFWEKKCVLWAGKYGIQYCIFQICAETHAGLQVVPVIFFNLIPTSECMGCFKGHRMILSYDLSGYIWHDCVEVMNVHVFDLNRLMVEQCNTNCVKAVAEISTFSCLLSGKKSQYQTNN
jgi:hypothetical protein